MLLVADCFQTFVVNFKRFVLAASPLWRRGPTNGAKHPEQPGIVWGRGHAFFQKRTRLLEQLLNTGWVFPVQVHQVAKTRAGSNFRFDEGRVPRNSIFEIGDSMREILFQISWSWGFVKAVNRSAPKRKPDASHITACA